MLPMKNILVTGGAGFIGSNLIQRLLDLNHSVVNLDNFDPFYAQSIKRDNLRLFDNRENYRFVEGDLLDRPLLNSLFSSDQPVDLVIHLAAKAGVRPSLIDPAGYFAANVTGTINLLDAMKAHDVRQMMFASSSSVYGNNKKLPFAETDNVDYPISPYAASKKSGELVCHTYHKLYDMDIFAYRFFTVYGPRQRPEMAIASFARNILDGRPITLYDGNGSTSRDYTYIDDIVDGLVASLDKLCGYEIFNLGESQVVKLVELVNLIEKYLGKKALIKFEGRQPGDVDATYADITKSKRLLGYNPKIKIEEGIERYCQWVKALSIER